VTARIVLVVVALLLVTVAAAQAAIPKASLKVMYWPHGRSAPPEVWTLRCSPLAGTHPARRIACGALAKHTADLRPATRACTLMPTRTSPQARIVGTWAGRSVDRGYRLGCPGWADLRTVLTGK